jgi:hypothetical protein
MACPVLNQRIISHEGIGDDRDMSQMKLISCLTPKPDKPIHRLQPDLSDGGYAALR